MIQVYIIISLQEEAFNEVLALILEKLLAIGIG
jgi:hypothetical protein